MVLAGVDEANLAEGVGLSQASIVNYLKGISVPVDHNLTKIAGFLNVHPTKFCGSYYKGGKYTPNRKFKRRKTRAEELAAQGPELPAKMTRGLVDWRVVEIGSNQISRAEALFHDPSNGILVLRLEDQ